MIWRRIGFRISRNELVYSIELIKETREQLHQFKPQAGGCVYGGFRASVTPEVVVELDENGEYQVRLVDDSLPPLRISEYYRKRLSDPNSSEEERNLSSEKIGSAQWLIESIQQRSTDLDPRDSRDCGLPEEILRPGAEAICP